MPGGIIVFGAPGAGSSTLGRALALALGFAHMDLDDYFWRWDTDIPYTAFRTHEALNALLLGDMEKAGHFVLSGSLGSNRGVFEPFFDLAVFLTAPAHTRVERLRARTLARFGARVLKGGDMYENNNRFIESSAGYETNGRLARHEEWIAALACPVLRVDGAKGVLENAAWIVERYRALFDG